MATKDIEQNLEKLRDLLEGEPQRKYASAIHERRVQELNRTITFADNKLKDQRKTRKRNQFVLIPIAVILMVTGILTLPGMGAGEGLYALAISTGLVGLFMILRSLNRNPLSDVSTRIDKMHSRLRHLQKAKHKKSAAEKETLNLRVHKAKKKKVIAGVAAELAARLDIPIALSRVLWVMFLLFSGGAAIGVYFLLWFVLRAFPSVFDDAPAPKRVGSGSNSKKEEPWEKYT